MSHLWHDRCHLADGSFLQTSHASGDQGPSSVDQNSNSFTMYMCICVYGHDAVPEWVPQYAMALESVTSCDGAVVAAQPLCIRSSMLSAIWEGF